LYLSIIVSIIANNMFLFDCDFCIFRISWFIRKTKKELEEGKERRVSRL